MDISGKIIQKLPLQSGESKTTGKPWQIQSYVLETQEQFPRKVCFEIFGEQRIKDNPCEIDDLVTVSFDLESRGYSGCQCSATCRHASCPPARSTGSTGCTANAATCSTT